MPNWLRTVAKARQSFHTLNSIPNWLSQLRSNKYLIESDRTGLFLACQAGSAKWDQEGRKRKEGRKERGRKRQKHTLSVSNVLHKREMRWDEKRRMMELRRRRMRENRKETKIDFFLSLGRQSARVRHEQHRHDKEVKEKKDRRQAAKWREKKANVLAWSRERTARGAKHEDTRWSREDVPKKREGRGLGNKKTLHQQHQQKMKNKEKDQTKRWRKGKGKGNKQDLKHEVREGDRQEDQKSHSTNASVSDTRIGKAEQRFSEEFFVSSSSSWISSLSGQCSWVEDNSYKLFNKL